MAIVSKGACQYGCSVYSLNGFPTDGADVWTKAELEKLKTQVTGLGQKRAYLLSLNSSQKKAKKILEDAGFKVIAVWHTAHIDWNADEIKQWKDDYAKGKMNNNTIYLMGRGFWAPKRVKKGA